MKRAAVIWPTGISSAANLAKTSKIGAVAQNPIIKNTPKTTRSVLGIYVAVLVIALDSGPLVGLHHWNRHRTDVISSLVHSRPGRPMMFLCTFRSYRHRFDAWFRCRHPVAPNGCHRRAGPDWLPTRP